MAPDQRPAGDLFSEEPAARLGSVTVKPPPFDYTAPDTLEEALTLLGEIGDDARPLAGGQSLIPLLSLRLARPSHLIDLARVASMKAVAATDDDLAIGAMVRERQVEGDERVRRLAPLLADALPLIGHPAIRSRGTIGGSLSHADPAAELPAVALVLEAELVAESRPRGRRAIPAADFFTGFFTTALEPDELLTSVRIPATAPGTGWAIEEVARRHGDFAVVGAAAMVRLDGDTGRVGEARLALAGVSDTPVRLREVEQMLAGTESTDEAFADAAAQAAAHLSPPADVHGSPAYRRHIAGVLARRTLTLAAQRAKEAA
jgi:aerobic carbon-monoxide dehydrogenase medium subunit